MLAHVTVVTSLDCGKLRSCVQNKKNMIIKGVMIPSGRMLSQISFGSGLMSTKPHYWKISTSLNKFSQEVGCHRVNWVLLSILQSNCKIPIFKKPL